MRLVSPPSMNTTWYIRSLMYPRAAQRSSPCRLLETISAPFHSNPSIAMKSTLCFSRLALRFASSHSYIMHHAFIVQTIREGNKVVR